MGEGSDQQQQSTTTTEETSATLRSLKSLNQLSQNLQNLINSSDKSGPELHNRISQLRASIERLRTNTNSIENINRSAEDQWTKIEDLRRQLVEKNEFFKRFREEKAGEGTSGAATSNQ
ncbi:unnamed protein product [Meloidogyne enterolobii]|uniref:Uncharacterized protein n=1 Tax=Meloidogyne enterolobii TaxID=390850 RepID=A0ACB1ALJ0_MELEN